MDAPPPLGNRHAGLRLEVGVLLAADLVGRLDHHVGPPLGRREIAAHHAEGAHEVPPSCTAGALFSSSAATGSCTPGCGSRSAATAAAPRQAASGVRPTTTASRSPTIRTCSAASSGWSGKTTPIWFAPGTSAAVSTATTPSTPRAAARSRPQRRAEAWGETASAAWSIPGSPRSPA
ncbi:MAG: hypothetical protein M5U13_17655 [Thermoanaerobaculia bacterium]|nr:hypothetical protein [Thermoanaerobaculia bacterium]